MKQVITHIIQQYEEVQNGKIWIGTSYERMLNSINSSSAFIRPLENMHSVAEIISHLTLWRKETILKIQTGKGSKTDDCEENWLNNEKLVAVGWNQLISEYAETLAKLIVLLKEKDDAFLSEIYYDTDFKNDYPYSFVINGMLHHDLYHLGQLGFVLKFLNAKENKSEE